MDTILLILIGLFVYWLFATVCEKIGDFIDFCSEKIAKMQGKKATLHRIDFKKDKRERKQQKRWDEKHIIRATLRDALFTLRRVLWYRVPDYPRDIRLWIKTKYQRAKRGWAISDAWGFHYYLAEVIRDGCKWLKKHKHGVPMFCDRHNIIKKKIKGYSEDRNFKEAEREWDDIIEQIIWTFDVVTKIDGHHWFYPHGRTYFTDKELKTAQELCEDFRDDWPEDKHKYHVMTIDECKQYRKGWDLFQKHFFDLWD